MVVVLSEVTAAHVSQLIASGWPGSVMVVGSVAEAREALEGQQPPAEPVGESAGLDLRAMRLDGDARRVVNPPESADLTPLEFGVLETLVAEPGRIKTFADLTSAVWGTSYTGDCSHLHAVIRRLRTKLETVHAPVAVAAVRGVGFRLAPVPTPAPHGRTVGLRGL